VDVKTTSAGADYNTFSRHPERHRSTTTFQRGMVLPSCGLNGLPPARFVLDRGGDERALRGGRLRDPP
jgi:hypothetical protein